MEVRSSTENGVPMVPRIWERETIGPKTDRSRPRLTAVNAPLGFLSVSKAYHQIVSVPEDNDDREVRISFSK